MANPPHTPPRTIHPNPAHPTHGPHEPYGPQGPYGSHGPHGPQGHGPYEPPTAHQRHHDYVYLENYGWYPSWYPYWDPYWYAYWEYLYVYYGGDEYADYAEYARDEMLRQYALQQGW